ncbi:hypothetical protein DFH09DRAFT_462875 [Mycena vulgaris]|nr:hypothetical protein DFH09DRAFT_462875 [Mycena vulgaris]
MSFALHNTHIDGGTFNNVSGNMSQVVHTHVTHIGAAAGRRLGERAHDSLLAGPRTTDGFIGAIRSKRGSRQGNTGPYATSEITRRMPRAIQGSSNGEANARFHPARIPPNPRIDSNSIVAAPTSAMPPENSSTTTFNSVGGDMTQLNVTSYGESGLAILYRHVVMEALHDSGERFPEPACHPGTRTDVFRELREWSLDTSVETNLLWLHGSAGAGKSAIAQMFAGDCQSQGRLGASFFFRRGHSKRGTWHGLFSTVAYQLAKSVPEFMVPVQQAIDYDPLVVGRAMAVQFQRLVVEPFTQTPTPRFRPFIVLDGLDECGDHKIQTEIIRLFMKAIQVHQLPIRILICSRPEAHLREVLEAEETLALCQQVELSADRSAYHDIRTYLRDEFARIHSECKFRGIDLGVDWPSTDALQRLVKKSSGLFIYASTVIRFVDDEYSHPIDRLESVLRLDPKSTAPLDDLYTEILSVRPQDPQQLRILHAVWARTLPPDLDMDPEEIDVLLSLRRGTCRMEMRSLHALFRVPPVRTRFGSRHSIDFLHASVADYFCDSRRSGSWSISVPWLRSDYLHCMIRLLSSPLTDSSWFLLSDVVYALPTFLADAIPSQELIQLLRNKDFQESIFLAKVEDRYGIWPQRDSLYPPDLIQLWEAHEFISRLSHSSSLVF